MFWRRDHAVCLALGAVFVAIGCATSATQPVLAPPTEVEVAPLPEASGPAVERAKKPHSNRIKWKTASELDNFGYDVYRGESSDGPFERITSEVIEGAGTTDEPTAYEYIDKNIDPYKTYYYYVESISMNGDRERFTPVGKAKPKIPDEDGNSDEVDEGDQAEPSREAADSGR